MKTKISLVLSALALAACMATAPARAQTFPPERLYKGVAPGSEKWTFPEVRQTTPDGGTSYSNVRDPEFTVYLPDAARANGAAVLYLPGGGLRGVGFGRESNDLVARLNARGVAVITLKYRVAQIDPDKPRTAAPIAFDQKLEIRNGNANPAPDDAVLNEALRLSTADAQETMRRIRAHAKAWRIDPARVGMFATSAGGGPAFGSLMAGEAASMPDFIIANYAPALQELTVGKDAPPLFMMVESGHGPVTDGLMALVPIWRAARRPVELHVYEVANFRMTSEYWGERMMKWLEEQRFIPAAARP